MRATFNTILPDFDLLISDCITRNEAVINSTANTDNYYVLRADPELFVLLPEAGDRADLKTLVVQANKIKRLLNDTNASDAAFSALYGSIVPALAGILAKKNASTWYGSPIYTSFQLKIITLKNQLELSRQIYEKDLARPKKQYTEEEKAARRAQKEREWEERFLSRLQAVGGDLQNASVARYRAHLSYMEHNPDYVPPSIPPTPSGSPPRSSSSSSATPSRPGSVYGRSGYPAAAATASSASMGQFGFPFGVYPGQLLPPPNLSRAPAPAANGHVNLLTNDSQYITTHFDADTFALLESLAKFEKIEKTQNIARQIILSFITNFVQSPGIEVVDTLNEAGNDEVKALIPAFADLLRRYSHTHKERLMQWYEKENQVIGNRKYLSPISQIYYKFKQFVFRPNDDVKYEHTLFPFLSELPAEAKVGIIDTLNDKMFAAMNLTERFTAKKRDDEKKKIKAADQARLQPDVASSTAAKSAKK